MDLEQRVKSLISAAEAARKLKMHPERLRRLMALDGFPKAVQGHNRVWFDRTEFEQWMENNPQPRRKRER